MKTAITILSVFSLLVGCNPSGQQTYPVDDRPAVAGTQADQISIYDAAVSNPARSEADRNRDAGRKPGEVLAFFNIEAGMQVLDMFSGGGYYTEILSYVVGPAGKVTSHSNESYAQYVADEAVPRYANERLPNVAILMAENNELELVPGEFDAVLMILAFHDIFYVDLEDGWPKIDGPTLLSELYASMRPGAVLGIVDHNAVAGSPSETGGTLHRIDPAIVVADMLDAGFVLEGQSEVLRNAEDDLSLGIFDPAVKGKTDRFVMRFTKPE